MSQVSRFQAQSTLVCNVHEFTASARSPVQAGNIRTRLRIIGSRFAAVLTAKLTHDRDRREIAAMGPVGRRELHALLMARGEGGISEKLWRAQDWADDATRL